MDKLDLILEKLDCLINRENSPDAVFVANKRIDSLGRLTLPISLRRELGIDEQVELKIYRDNEQIIIKKG